MSSRFGRTVTIEQLELNPFSLSAAAHNLIAREIDGLKGEELRQIAFEFGLSKLPPPRSGN